MVGLPVPEPIWVQNLIQTRGDNLLASNRCRPEKSTDNSANKLLRIITQKQVIRDPTPKGGNLQLKITRYWHNARKNWTLQAPLRQKWVGPDLTSGGEWVHFLKAHLAYYVLIFCSFVSQKKNRDNILRAFILSLHSSFLFFRSGRYLSKGVAVKSYEVWHKKNTWKEMTFYCM